MTNIFKEVFTVVATGIKDVEADLKDLFFKAKPIVTAIAVDATDLLEGKLPPPTGSKALDDAFKAILILVPYYKGNKTAVESALAELVHFIDGAIVVL